MKKNDKNFFNKLLIYLSCYDTAISIHTQYVTVLSAFELGVFGFFLVIVQGRNTYPIWVIPIVGITLCLLFALSSKFHAKNIDVWQRSIANLVTGSELETIFRQGKFGAQSLRFKFTARFHFLVGHWFENIVIPVIIMLWLYIAVYFCYFSEYFGITCPWSACIVCVILLVIYIGGLVFLEMDWV